MGRRRGRPTPSAAVQPTAAASTGRGRRRLGDRPGRATQTAETLDTGRAVRGRSAPGLQGWNSCECTVRLHPADRRDAPGRPPGPFGVVAGPVDGTPSCRVPTRWVASASARHVHVCVTPSPSPAYGPSRSTVGLRDRRGVTTRPRGRPPDTVAVPGTSAPARIERAVNGTRQGGRRIAETAASRPAQLFHCSPRGIFGSIASNPPTQWRDRRQGSRWVTTSLPAERYSPLWPR